MKLFFLRQLLLAMTFVLISACSIAQINDPSFIIGDALPDAPSLSPRGEYQIGVRTLELVHTNQVDILNSNVGVDPMYDRHLKLEVWYPALIPQNKTALVTYNSTLGMYKDSSRPLISFTFTGRALRDAAPLKTAGKFPLIIVSHGYVGSRVLMTYLTENLASKGYIVVAIDHTESTNSDKGGFQSTLLNRAKDILFVLNQVADLAKMDSKNFLAGLADTDNTGLIGYSMGGFGVLNAAGAGYSVKLETAFEKMTGGSKAIDVRLVNNEAFKASQDTRIKAVVAFAPWGMQLGVWDSTGLLGLKVPVFFVAGSLDDVSGYQDGIKAIYKGAANANRYLLTYENARHNIAPNPPPAASLKAGVAFDDYYHYAEPAWNEYRINNINQHFVTGFLGIYLKQKDYDKYLNLPENSNEKTWNGFKPRTSAGLELIHDLPK